ncbi:hypothetical protein NKH77_41810 [Streptomyces sp. M19]
MRCAGAGAGRAGGAGGAVRSCGYGCGCAGSPADAGAVRRCRCWWCRWCWWCGALVRIRVRMCRFSGRRGCGAPVPVLVVPVVRSYESWGRAGRRAVRRARRGGR